MKGFHATEIRLRVRDPSNWESWIALWKFIDGRSARFPVLQALAVQLGCLCREGLEKCYSDRIQHELKKPESDMTKIKDLYEKLYGNLKSKETLWERAHRTRHTLLDLGEKSILGPWTSIADATTYALNVLTAFEKVEKVGWKKDDEF